MYVCVSAYVCACEHMCTRVCVYVCLCVYECVCVCRWPVCVRVYTCVYVLLCLYPYRVCVYTCVCFGSCVYVCDEEYFDCACILRFPQLWYRSRHCDTNSKGIHNILLRKNTLNRTYYNAILTLVACIQFNMYRQHAIYDIVYKLPKTQWNILSRWLHSINELLARDLSPEWIHIAYRVTRSLAVHMSVMMVHHVMHLSSRALVDFLFIDTCCDR